MFMQAENFETYLTSGALLVASIALILNFLSNRYQRKALEDQIYQQFTKMWIEMDHLFIEYPNMHKYFYPSHKKRTCSMPKIGSEDYELAICIAEIFRDMFQYAEHLIKYIPRDYALSYYHYMKRIMSTPIYKHANELNPMQYTNVKRIGQKIEKYLRLKVSHK